MTNPLTLATKTFLAPANITENNLADLLQRLHGPTIDDADLYFQYLQSEVWALEDGIVKDAQFCIDQGVGVRALSGVKTGFAYSDEITLAALQEATQAARGIAALGQSGATQISHGAPHKKPHLYAFTNPVGTLTENDKVALLQTVYAEILRQDKRIVHASVGLGGSYEIILVVNDDGVLGADIRPLVRLNVNVVLAEHGRRERGSSGAGGRFSYEYFTHNGNAKALWMAREAVRIALVNLQAEHAPAGNMPVVLGPGWPGILLHEAIGHGLEGDFNRKGSSIFANRIGERVATPLCTVIDQGNLADGQRGSLHMDDEGTPTQRTVLIENGILCGYMQDRLNARLMGGKSTGNGRRESYSYIPLPRMTSTYMVGGQEDPAAIIASVDKGLYAVNFSGGQVDITSGNFVFTTSEAYLIEHGKITRPVKDAALIGNGPDVLTKVSMLGNDLTLDPGIGTCGKEGQSVPVNVGQPTLKIDSLTVGGST